MKRLILTFVIILLSTNILNAATFKWTDKMKTIDDGTEFYIDKKSIRNVDNYVYYWSLANYLKHEEGENTDIKSVITFHRIDCNDMGYQIILMSFYGQYMGKGKNLTHFIDPDTEEEKRYHPENSISYNRHQKLCKK